MVLEILGEKRKNNRGWPDFRNSVQSQGLKFKLQENETVKVEVSDVDTSSKFELLLGKIE